MLKTIGIIGILALSTNLFAHEYEVQIHDYQTGEFQIEKCANEGELNTVTNFLINHTDSSIEFRVKKTGFNTADAIKRGGGEGSGD